MNSAEQRGSKYLIFKKDSSSTIYEIFISDYCAVNRLRTPDVARIVIPGKAMMKFIDAINENFVAVKR